MEITNLAVFCSPAESYKGMREREVVKVYRQMAIDGYDAFVRFSPDYENSKNIPDLVSDVGKKQGLRLSLQAFLGQDVEKFGDIQGEFISSSYLFNPFNPDKPKRLLPDLDVIDLCGENVEDVAEEVVDFYERHEWKTEVFFGEIPTKVFEPSINSRLWKMQRKSHLRLAIHDLNSLREIAQRIVGYNPNKLCWEKR